jgi:MtN3 and saliva related transmembrane protein
LTLHVKKLREIAVLDSTLENIFEILINTYQTIGYLAAILTTASFLPQAFLTLKTRDTESLSLGMYSIFTLGVFLWLIYGLSISNKAIIFSNAITLVLCTSILTVKIYNTFKKK